ncbi:MAG: hypothetical protein Q8Q25_02220 [bacterium]|nr:hypothetical protein [bacterium]
MNKKQILVLAVLCWVTTSNSMGTTTSELQKFVIDKKFAEEHERPFRSFVEDMKGQITVIERVAHMPLIGRVMTLGAQATGYGDAIKNVDYLKRFFEDEIKKRAALDALFENDTSCAQTENFLTNIFTALGNQGRLLLLKLLHEENVKELRQPEGTTQDELCKKVVAGDISDATYFGPTSRILLAIYMFESGSYKKGRTP